MSHVRRPDPHAAPRTSEDQVTTEQWFNRPFLAALDRDQLRRALRMLRRLFAEAHELAIREFKARAIRELTGNLQRLY